jgi:hypothetical protein
MVSGLYFWGTLNVFMGVTITISEAVRAAFISPAVIQSILKS